MIKDKEYRFPVSLSKEIFIDKIIAGAMIGDNTKENKEIRKQYGLSAIHYYRKDVTSGELLNYLLDGHSVCHLFKNTNGYDYFYKNDKVIKNFEGAYCICVDIDKTKFTLEEYIEKLPMKPTFYYTSYSHMKDGKGARFRMVYVFNKLIKNHYIFRYCCKCLNDMIENNVETIEDKCNLVSTQYFNGTHRSFNPSYGITDIIYDFNDFGIEGQPCIDYMINYCEYKSPQKEHKENIKEILYKLTGRRYVFNLSTMSFVLAPKTLLSSQPTDTNQGSNKCSYWLVKYFRDNGLDSYDKFMKTHWKDYSIFYRKESDKWIDDSYQYVDDTYICLPYYARKIKDRNKRRKKIFERACLRRLINPEATADELFINSCWDVRMFFDNTDGIITADCIQANVEKAVSLSLEEIVYMYGEHIDLIKKQKTPKDNIIFKKGTKKTKTKRRNIKFERMNEVYDRRKTDKENIEIIKDQLGINVSLRTIKRFRKEYGITKYKKNESVKSDNLLNKSVKSDYLDGEEKCNSSKVSNQITRSERMSVLDFNNLNCKSNKEMDKQSLDNWITEVTDRIKTDPFIQSHRGREYAIRIGLIKDDTPKKANVDVEFRTDEFTERIDQIKELNHTLF